MGVYARAIIVSHLAFSNAVHLLITIVGLANSLNFIHRYDNYKD